MDKYINQLLADIEYAENNVPDLWWETFESDNDMLFTEEEEENAPRKSIEEWTGIKKIQLPPAKLLSKKQISRLLPALINLLDSYNCMVVFQIEVPEEIQYHVIRERFDQESPQLRVNDHFFEFCEEGQDHDTCLMGEYCHCAFFQDFFSRFDNEDEELKLDLFDIHMSQKYGKKWDEFKFFFEDDEDWEFEDL